MTPLDRYRKHYALFDYWNAELLNALQSPSLSTTMGPGQPRVNPKRLKLASQESLQELTVLQELLQPEKAAQLTVIVAQRLELDERIQTEAYTASQLDLLARTVEAQGRQIDRGFYWRHMTDFLNPVATPEEPASSPPSDANGN